MQVTRKSPFSGKTHTLELPITEEQVQKWADGALIQDAFPGLSPAEREFIMSGITSEEWNEMFGSDADVDGEVDEAPKEGILALYRYRDDGDADFVAAFATDITGASGADEAIDGIIALFPDDAFTTRFFGSISDAVDVLTA